MKKKLKLFLLTCLPLFSVACSPISNIVWVKLFPPIVIEIGDNMVDAKLLDVNENKINLSNYLSDKYLLLNFCSSGCGNCKASLPEMKEIAEIFHENLTIINIGLESENRWKNAMTEQNTTWVNLRDPKSHGGLAAKYGNDFRVPYFVIISPEGKIVDKWFGYNNGLINRKINENVYSASINK